MFATSMLLHPFRANRTGWNLNDLVLNRLIHYKPKKKKNSTRCWCFIEREDLKPGPQVLELYAKPSDPGRKKKLKLCATLNSCL